MPTSRLLCAALLLGAPLASLAQSTSPAPTRRFYVGLAVYDGANQSVRGFYSGQRFNLPVQATLGYQLQPRLALQVGLVYSGYKDDYTNSFEYTGSNSQLVTYYSANTLAQRAASASLLARYTLTRQASHRLQADLVGGLSFNHSSFKSSGTNTYLSQGVIEAYPFDNSSTSNSLRANLGPSVRYRFGERLEAVGDILFNILLTSTPRNPNTAVALGLRYRFGELR